MVFGKGNQKNVSELGKRGYKAVTKKYDKNPGQLFAKSLSDIDNFTKRQKHSSRVSKIRWNNMSDEDKFKTMSEMGKKSRLYENSVADNLKKEYDEIFQPFRVCDRICVKDGKITFIEIKKNNTHKLRPQQKKFKELCEQNGYDYIIEYYE